jgi:hypothetical protein
MEQIDTIYDRYGKPVLRLFASGRFVSFGGKSIGFLEDNDLYNYSGEHIGWYEGGIMRDHQGKCVGFGENPTDSLRPFLPFKQFKPFPAYPEYEPSRPHRQFAPPKPRRSFSWSDYEPIQLFLEGE